MVSGIFVDSTVLILKLNDFGFESFEFVLIFSFFQGELVAQLFEFFFM